MSPSIDFRMVGVNSVRRNVWNARVVGDGDPDILELASSIQTNGLQQPVKVRPVAHDGDVLYELIFGERRWRACVVLGFEEIPAIVEEMGDDRAKTLTALENLQRRDLEPLVAAVSIQNLFDLGWTAEQVGQHLGKPAQWVARRAQLTKLSAGWRKLMGDVRQAVSRWSSSHLEIIARMPENVQDALAAEDFDCKERDYKAKRDYDEVLFMTTAELRRELAEFCRALDGAPWKTGDGDLVLEAGNCDACLKRSDRQAELFDADEFDGDSRKRKSKSGAMCLDDICWKRKMEACLKAKASELQLKHGDVVIVGYDREAVGGAFEGKTVNSWDVRECKKNEAGAKPALVVAGQGAGRQYWVKAQSIRRGKSESGAGTGKKKPKSVAEKKREYDWRRTRLIIVKLAERFERLHDVKKKEQPPKHLSDRDLLALVVAFGTKGRAQSFDSSFGDRREPMKTYATLQKCDPGQSLEEMLWRDACGRVGDLLRCVVNFSFSEVNEKMQRERIEDWRGCAEILGLESGELWMEACGAIKYPKAWAAAAEKSAAKPKPKPEPKAKPKPKADPEYALAGCEGCARGDGAPECKGCQDGSNFKKPAKRVVRGKVETKPAKRETKRVKTKTKPGTDEMPTMSSLAAAPKETGWAYSKGQVNIDTDSVLLVEKGLNDTFMTFRRVIGSLKRSRVKSAGLPVRAGQHARQAAQKELDAYALKNGLMRCCRVCGCTETHACGGGCSWVADGVCSTHGDSHVDELPEFGAKGDEEKPSTE